MNSVLVIRFGALGDLCLVGWTLTRLVTAAERAAGRLTLVTKARFAGLAREFRGIDRVIPLAEPGRAVDLVRLARELRADPDDLMIDAHRVLRSRLLGTQIGRAHV
jgi:ADP-heptose:LPS heptosyltransferase